MRLPRLWPGRAYHCPPCDRVEIARPVRGSWRIRFVARAATDVFGWGLFNFCKGDKQEFYTPTHKQIFCPICSINFHLFTNSLQFGTLMVITNTDSTKRDRLPRWRKACPFCFVWLFVGEILITEFYFAVLCFKLLDL